LEENEKTDRMLQAIREEYQKGKMPEEVYRILMERWGGEPEQIPEEVEEAVEFEVPARRLPPRAGPEDVEALVFRLLKDTDNLKGEIVELEVEKETTEGTLKGLEKKLSAGAIEKSRFAKISRQYAMKIKEIDAQIAKKRGQVESIQRRLKRVKSDIRRKIDAYTQALQKVEKAVG
jgi:hypothetical protein